MHMLDNLRRGGIRELEVTQCTHGVFLYTDRDVSGPYLEATMMMTPLHCVSTRWRASTSCCKHTYAGSNKMSILLRCFAERTTSGNPVRCYGCVCLSAP